jgi:response regulator RpfG family c-di-GMP phosphodiesterase
VLLNDRVSEEILVVDDEKNVLDSLKRSLSIGFKVHTALSAEEGLELIKEKENLSVVISDYRMPGMDGLIFLSRVQQAYPQLVRIMLTGVYDSQVFKETVNRCKVFRLLLKPCPAGELIGAVNDGVAEHHRLAGGYSYGDKPADCSTSCLLAAMTERNLPAGVSADRIAEYCYLVGLDFGLGGQQLSDLENLARLHDVGMLGIPDEILFKDGPLSEEEWVVMRLHPEKGYRIALSTPELSHLANMILAHHERWDGKGYPLGLKGEEIPLESRILAVVKAYEAMTRSRPYRAALSEAEALAELRAEAGSQFDPELVKVFISLMAKLNQT